MRQRGTAVGLLQLCKELLDAGVLTQDAVVRARLDTIMALPKGVPAMTPKDAATPH